MKIYPNLTLIVAMTRSRIFGDARTNTLPWKAPLPRDLPWFKRWTIGGHLIVGRRTWESLPGLLPHRGISVVTSKPETLKTIKDSCVTGGRIYRKPGNATPIGRVCRDVIEALNAVDPDTPVFAAGGRGIYQRLLPHAASSIITLVDDHHLRDDIDPVYFPHVAGKWADETVEDDEENGLKFKVMRRSGA